MTTLHSIPRRWLGLGLLAGFATAASLAQSNPTLVRMFEMTQLKIAGDGATKAYALNNTGQVVGWAESGSSRHSAQWHNHAVTDLHGTVHFALAHPYALFDQNYSEAYRISDGDQIVGTAKTSVQCADNPVVILNAYILRAAVLTDLATPIPGDALTNLKTFGHPCPVIPGEVAAYDSAAISISNNNHIVGWADRSDGVIHAFILVPVGGQFFSDLNADGINDLMIDLGTLTSNSDPVSSATGVNDVGQVTGYSYVAPGTGSAGYHAFLVTPLDTDGDGVGDEWFVGVNGVNTLMQDLGTLNGTNSWGRDINDAGDVVGESDIDVATGEHYTQAFLYRNGSMVALGTLRTDRTRGFSAASAINTQGTVVGWAENDRRQRRAFLYENGQMIDLNTLAFERNDKGNATPAGLILTEARDINEDGVIVGWGTVGTSEDALTVGFLLNPVMVSPDILQPPDPNDSNTTTGTNNGGNYSPASGTPDFGAPANLYGSGGSGANDANTAEPTTRTPAFCGAGTLGFIPLTLAGLLGLRASRQRR